jgi:hypothetical protein
MYPSCDSRKRTGGLFGCRIVNEGKAETVPSITMIDGTVLAAMKERGVGNLRPAKWAKWAERSNSGGQSISNLLPIIKSIQSTGPIGMVGGLTRHTPKIGVRA